MRRSVLIALALLGLSGAGYGGWWLLSQRNGGVETAAAAAPGAAVRGRGAGAPAVPVTVVAAARQDVPVLLEALGTVQASASVTVRAQVDGQLLEVLFREGQEVRQGEVLARIDPRLHQAALDQALAKKAQDEALLANARLDLERYTRLARNDGVSRQQQDTQRALVAQLEAQVAADQAAIDTARTQLSFTAIRAPIEGRVGLRLVDPGNLVRAGDATGIVTIARLRPIHVVFTLPQQEIGRVLAAMERGPVPVEARLRAGEDAPVARGVLLTLDNQVDPATGTIRLKAEFANEDGRLWPGAFVAVRLRIETLDDVTTVPLVAVQRGPDGPYAFVLRPDRTVEQRPLELGVQTGTVAVVTRGLQPGERVVTSGALRLNDGARVAVAAEEPAPPGGEPPAAPRRGRPRQAADAAPPRAAASAP
ncbi:efflux RND transporter periplasmic adaptor subunit [Caldovatus aquaticus]|uniref:Efflux RND transporter periplasmic adaptor subunit n=1 Tax=Caldovatus aquaticus TaxID=2865671 RepID=A0ABS7F5M9_9PROT|nr:efflux RND transporter periplasmic adaptor subunit [Caldovatus aquaticus]MBW8270111.1 efflux RND transporter periplasmic adaptor subunit [Caldovatus aquaticus]